MAVTIAPGKLSASGVAALFGVTLPVGEGIDALVAALGWQRGQRVRDLCRCLEDDLDALRRAQFRTGDLAAAAEAFGRARDAAAAQGTERDVMVADNELGDLARAEGRLDEAAERYTAGLAIAERLAAADPRTTLW